MTIVFPFIRAGEFATAKAEKIIRECEEKTGSISYGRIEVVSYMNTRHDSKMEPYLKYRDMGLVTIHTLPTTTKGSWGRKVEAFQIELTQRHLNTLFRVTQLAM